ncbi:MAG: chaperonin GroEL [Gracilibacteraceae bacterium]|jgi:chaperonin GroEL|nr:chaperonin GroEL [Gracilibacteraceae bacterium]
MDVREAVIRGVEQVADLAGQTLGPLGRSIVISRYPRSPLVTRDGRVVADHIFPRGRHENMGAAYCREAAAQTKTTAGDGSTTALILLRELLRRGQTAIRAGLHPLRLRRALDALLPDILAYLAAEIVPADEAVLRAVATQAAQSPALGDLTARVLTGLAGGERLTVRPSPRGEHYTERSRPEGAERDEITVFVGAATEAETFMLVAREQDALCAARAAALSGALPGAASVLGRAARVLRAATEGAAEAEIRAAGLIWSGALTAPLERLAQNAGAAGGRVAARLGELPQNISYDAQNGSFTDARAAGLYDAALAARTALQTAGGLAGLILTAGGEAGGRAGAGGGTATLGPGGARAALRRGAGTLAAAVAVTLGPRGGQVYVAPEKGFPRFTRSGAGIARIMRLPDEFADLGCALLREAAEKTAEQTGDGATTAMVLAWALLTRFWRLQDGGWAAPLLARGLEWGLAHTARYLAAAAVPAREEDLGRVAALAGGAEAGELAGAAFALVGGNGVIKIEESPAPRSAVAKIPGISFPRGFISPRMVTHPAENLSVLADALIFMTDRRIAYADEVENILTVAVQERRPLLIIAADLSTDLLTLFLTARRKGGMEVTVVLPPAAGARGLEELRDIAVITGGRVLSAAAETDWAEVTAAWLGRAERVEVGAKNTSIIGGGGERAAIAAREAEVLALAQGKAPGWSKDKLETRLGWLRGGAARIKVGGMTRPVMLERLERVRAAVRAAQTALRTGLLPGGGLAFLRAAEALEEDLAGGIYPEGGGEAERAGLQAYALALREPLRRLAANAGESGESVLARLRRCPPEVGFDAATGELAALPALEAAGVAAAALDSAASAAALMLNTGGLVLPGPARMEEEQA